MENLQEIKDRFAPTGHLRVSINLGNPILAKAEVGNQPPSGVSVDLAKEFAKRLGLEIEWVVFNSAGESVEAVTSEDADIGFFAIDPLRGVGVNFSAAYVHITGSYLVPEESELQTIEEVDQSGNRIVVGKGSAYDLYLTRNLKNASIVRAPTSPKVVEFFVQNQCEVAAGVTQQLESDLQRFPNHRLLSGNFMLIQQAMGVPVSRGDLAAQYLANFVEEVKRTGFVAEALIRNGIKGASVAPQVGE